LISFWMMSPQMLRLTLMAGMDLINWKPKAASLM